MTQNVQRNGAEQLGAGFPNANRKGHPTGIVSSNCFQPAMATTNGFLTKRASDKCRLSGIFDGLVLLLEEATNAFIDLASGGYAVHSLSGPRGACFEFEKLQLDLSGH